MHILITGVSGFIGSNLAVDAIAANFSVTGLDKRAPLFTHNGFKFHQGDLCDQAYVTACIREAEPDVVVHLAARTDIDSADPSVYSPNIETTQNLMRATFDSNLNARFIAASTMLVNKLGYGSGQEGEYSAETGYGISKARMERWIRSGECGDRWVIIRPTTIWGPWHIRWCREFLGRVERKRFFHPSNGTCLRSYGYVGNVVHQILQMIKVPDEQVHGKTFYVGDPAVRLDSFVDSCYRAYHNRSAPRLPYALLKAGALLGDALGQLSVKLPVTSYRLQNMTTDNVIDVQRTLDLCGPSPYSMEEGIEKTVRWARENRALWM